MSTLFGLKNIPVFFFKNAEKYGQNCIKFNPPPPPPPPPPSVSKQRRISILESQNTVRVFYAIGGGGGGVGVRERRGVGGGWTLKNVFEALFPGTCLQGHVCIKYSPVFVCDLC